MNHAPVSELLEQLREMTEWNHGRDNLADLYRLRFQVEELHVRTVLATDRALEAWAKHHTNPNENEF